MANPEHVGRLKRSVTEWNVWRREHPDIRPNLSKSDLTDLDLREADLSSVDLREANLTKANLSRAYLPEADLDNADLREANLSGAALMLTSLRSAILRGVNLREAHLPRANFAEADLKGAFLNKADLLRAEFSVADLSESDLSEAHLHAVNLIKANLSYANLSETNLVDAILTDANLISTNFARARFLSTTFAWVNLNNVRGLETAVHDGPSIVDINSVILPHDESTRLHFLRGVGFTETQIEYLPSLLTPRPIQYHSLFISFAHQDKAIAERLSTDFRKHDIPCWFAPHELVPGDYYRHKIDKAIHTHDKLALILSEHSIKSQWVEKEVETALKREESMNMDQQVLFPIRLDDTVMTTSRRWISSLRYHRHIGDFTGWQDDVTYQDAFSTLLRHLKVDR